MSKIHRKPKTSASKQSRRPNQRARRNPLITPAEARRSAQRHVLDRLFKGSEVQDGATVRLGIYIRGDWSARDIWVVYKNSESLSLKSSDVVVVSKRTGRVLYEGSAGDEG